MQKLTAIIQTEKGKSKKVTVWVEDKTACDLLKYGNKEQITAYITEEYKSALIERKETRRHTSMQLLYDKGIEIEDAKADVFLQVTRNMDNEMLKIALNSLTVKQRYIFLNYVLEKESFRVIGEKLGIGKDTVREHYYAALKKLKKFLK